MRRTSIIAADAIGFMTVLRIGRLMQAKEEAHPIQPVTIITAFHMIVASLTERLINEFV